MRGVWGRVSLWGMRMRMPVLLGRREPDPFARQQPLRIRGRNVAWLPPLVVLLAVPVVDWFTSGDFRVISWLVLVNAWHQSNVEWRCVKEPPPVASAGTDAPAATEAAAPTAP